MKRLKIFLLILSFFFAIGIYFVTPISAQTSQPDTQALILQLQEQIKDLQEQITKLQAEVSLTKTELEAVKTELKFTKALRLGARGDEVKQLQEFLKSFPDIYPQGLVTGYFGPLTEIAVRKFQEKQGIESIGIVGPKTLSKLNELITEGAGASSVIPPGLLTAPGIQKKLEANPSTGSGQATTTPAQPISTSTMPIATTTPSGTIPAVPATPATPAIPTSISGTPTVPATPATPTTPAQPATTATSTATTATSTTASAILAVSSTPSGGTVTNINSGYAYCQATPCIVRVVVPPNSINIKVSKTGYQDWTNLIYLYADQTTDVDARLLALSGTTDTTPPSVPIGLTATVYSFSTSQITVSWYSSTDDVGVVGYKIYRDGAFITNYTNTGYPSFSTYYNGENLAAGTTYSFTVAAYDVAGNVSEQQSSPASARTYEAPTTIFPNGGETLKISNSSNLKWHSTTAGQKVSIYIFKAGDTNNLLQAAFNVTANNAGENSIPWTVSTYGLSLPSGSYKDLGTGQYYTRVCPSEILDQSMANGFNCDDSNALFTIETQSTTTTSSLNTRSKNLAAILQIMGSLSETLEKLLQLIK